MSIHCTFFDHLMLDCVFMCLEMRYHGKCALITAPHQVWEEMVSACWCGLLAALSLLLDAR